MLTDRSLHHRGMRFELTAIRELGRDLRAIVWPCHCLVCATPNRQLCRECESELRATIGRRNRIASTLLPVVLAYGPYEGAVRQLIVRFKHGGAIWLAPLLGALLAGPLLAALELGTAPVLIVTAPSRRETVRRRGYRHLDLLVRHALRYCGSRDASAVALGYFVPGALSALPGRSGQVGLSAGLRRKNAALVRVPARMRGRLRGREVVLVDDIMTTGATVSAAVEALAKVGAKVISVALISNTVRKDQIISD